MTNSANTTEQAAFNHRQVLVDGVSLHVVTAGEAAKPAILFLHGFPENWQAFRHVMTGLSDEFYTIAIDLPGIGSSGKIESNDKRTIARYVKGVIDALKVKDVTLVGHDAGGMVTYAYLHAYPNELAKAVIMNVVIPGIDPWETVKNNPRIWHFAFHAIPELPEALITGSQRVYFDYYYNTITAQPDRIDEQTRNSYAEAYSSPDALHTGFEWYRTFPQDEKDNARTKGNQISIPILYLREDREYGNIDDYLKSFRESGLVNVQGKLLTGSGHFAPEEVSEDVVNSLKTFMTTT
ncbi:alpha/beta fold hydrolase [Spirosoma jeollabukense]